MVRRKGEITSAMIERRYPFQVQHWHRGGGKGRSFWVMLEWLKARGYNSRTVGRWDNGWQATRYCFATRRQADEFAMDFGGERIDRAWRMRAFTIQPYQEGEARTGLYRLLPTRTEDPD